MNNQFLRRILNNEDFEFLQQNIHGINEDLLSNLFQSLTVMSNNVGNSVNDEAPRFAIQRTSNTDNSVASDLSLVQSNKNNFLINVDVQHFRPEELQVRAADGWVTIEARHAERTDEHGFIERQFIRRYKLPETVEEGNVMWNISSDGVLTVKNQEKPEGGVNIRTVPIAQIGQPPARKPSQDHL